jgi:hypothetical protein
MDNDKQNLAGLFNLKAYGLVNDLLWNGIPVRWAIRAGKAKDGIDFTAQAQRIFPTATAPVSLDFRGGPFIVHRDWAGFAKLRIANFGGSVAVYELTAATTIDIRHKLLQRRKIGVLNDGNNVAIHRAVLDAAGFVSGTQYVEIPAATLTTVNATSCFTGVSEPHWDSSAIDTQAQAVRTFLVSGGNFLAQCVATLTYENNVAFGRFQTTAGLIENNIGERHLSSLPSVVPGRARRRRRLGAGLPARRGLQLPPHRARARPRHADDEQLRGDRRTRERDRSGLADDVPGRTQLQRQRPRVAQRRADVPELDDDPLGAPDGVRPRHRRRPVGAAADRRTSARGRRRGRRAPRCRWRRRRARADLRRSQQQRGRRRDRRCAGTI